MMSRNLCLKWIVKLDPYGWWVVWSYYYSLSHVVIDLGRRLASCHKLELLYIPGQPHVAQGVIGGSG